MSVSEPTRAAPLAQAVWEIGQHVAWCEAHGERERARGAQDALDTLLARTSKAVASSPEAGRG